MGMPETQGTSDAMSLLIPDAEDEVQEGIPGSKDEKPTAEEALRRPTPSWQPSPRRPGLFRSSFSSAPVKSSFPKPLHRTRVCATSRPGGPRADAWSRLWTSSGAPIRLAWEELPPQGPPRVNPLSTGGTFPFHKRLSPREQPTPGKQTEHEKPQWSERPAPSSWTARLCPTWLLHSGGPEKSEHCCNRFYYEITIMSLDIH